MKKKVHLFIVSQNVQNIMVKIITDKRAKYGQIVFKDLDLFSGELPDLLKGIGIDVIFGSLKTSDLVDRFIRTIKFVDGTISFISSNPNVIELIYKLSKETVMDFDLTIHRVEFTADDNILNWYIGRENPGEGQLSSYKVLENAFDDFNTIFDTFHMLDTIHDHNNKSELDEDCKELLRFMRL